MDLKVKRINWMGNVYHKFEAVCQEVDDIVGQDAVKYLENQVQNVGDSVKKFYSDIVQDLLPLPALINSTNYEAHSVPLDNNVGYSIKEAADVKDDNNNRGDKEDPVNNIFESLLDSNAIDHVCNHQALASIEHNPANQASCENYSDFPEVQNSHLTKEEVDDDNSREVFGAKEENLHASIENIAIQSASQLMNLICTKQKEPLQFSIHSESSSGSSDIGCGVLVREKGVNVEQNLCSIVENNATNSSISQVLNFKSLGEKEPLEASLLSKLSDAFDQNTHGVLAVKPAVSSVSYKRPMTKGEPLCSKSSLVSDDSSMVHVCCELSSHAAGQIMESQDGLVSSGPSLTMEPNDESPVNDIDSSLKDIRLDDDAKLEESCVFVDDCELYAVSCRAQKLRSYKNIIRDAFSSKKRIVKEYEQLAIWYGDTDIEPDQGSLRSLLPVSSRTHVESKNLQAQRASESDWELL